MYQIELTEEEVDVLREALDLLFEHLLPTRTHSETGVVLARILKLELILGRAQNENSN